MSLFDNKKTNPPAKGYEFLLWNQVGYRATALAYMVRLGQNWIENINGNTYSIDEIKNAIIN